MCIAYVASDHVHRIASGHMHRFVIGLICFVQTRTASDHLHRLVIRPTFFLQTRAAYKTISICIGLFSDPSFFYTQEPHRTMWFVIRWIFFVHSITAYRGESATWCQRCPYGQETSFEGIHDKTGIGDFGDWLARSFV